MGFSMKVMQQDKIALDRASVRTVSPEGHLHVKVANLSKADINPYLGNEIPGWEEAGLDPSKIYKLFRDPDELAKAAESIDGKPILFSHKPTGAEDHDHMNTVGSISEPEYEHPFLRGKLTIWPADAIRAVQTGEQRELSCGYRYRPDFTPGTYDGKPYDAVMRDISFNHCAIVTEGRAGPECYVGDSAIIKDLTSMKPTALTRVATALQGGVAVYLMPKMAQDAKPINFAPALKSITKANFASKIPALAADIKTQTTGKLAKDASIEDVAEVLEALAPILPDDEPIAGSDGDDGASMDSDDAELMAMLKAKGYSDEEAAAICTKTTAAAQDEGKDEEERKRLAEAVAAKDAEMKDMVKKPAMDAAIKAAVKIATDAANKNQASIRDAERFVRPWVGELAMSFDSAEAVLRSALSVLKVEGVEDLHPDALRPILAVQPKPGDKPRSATPRVTMDAASASDYEKMFPDANRLAN